MDAWVLKSGRIGAFELLGEVAAQLGELRFEGISSERDAAPAAFVRRAVELVARAGELALGGNPEGVGLMVRTAFEAATLAVWVASSPGNFERLSGDHSRSIRRLSTKAVGGALDPLLVDWPESQRMPPFEQVVAAVGAWLLEQGNDHASRFSEFYDGFYRLHSTVDVHNWGPAVRYLRVENETYRVADYPRLVGMHPMWNVVATATVVGWLACVTFEACQYGSTNELRPIVDRLADELDRRMVTVDVEVVSLLERLDITPTLLRIRDPRNTA
jgi:hypothetical protein